MNAQVLPFACLAQYPSGPTYGPTPVIACTRQRWHPGDHRAPHSGQLLEWPDPPAPVELSPSIVTVPPPPQEAAMAFGDKRPVGTTYPGHLEETDESWGELKVARDPRDGFWRIVRALAAVVLLTVTLCGPAFVIAVYRAVL